MFSKLTSWVTKSSEKFETVISTIPTYSVEEIHEAFDKGEQEVIDECTKVLAELKIPTETQIERKASLMQELGFHASETVEQAKVLKDRTLKIKEERSSKELVANTINEFRVSYPKEKFITEDKLNELCKKYNLMYAPIKNYIKDVPEKNLLDIKNRKLLSSEDTVKNLYKFETTKNRKDEFQLFLNAIGKPDGIIEEGEDVVLLNKYDLDYGGELKKNPWGIESSTWMYVIWNHINIGRYNFSTVEVIEKSGLFVAAPKSHFNLDGISKENEFGFFDVKHVEVKDPIVFEFCKNNLVRIVTKWGTEDDQSFLDPIVQNSQNN